MEGPTTSTAEEPAAEQAGRDGAPSASVSVEPKPKPELADVSGAQSVSDGPSRLARVIGAGGAGLGRAYRWSHDRGRRLRERWDAMPDGRFRRLRSAALALALSLVGLASVAILAVYLLAGASPSWWAPVDVNDQATEAGAKRIHVALTNQLNARRDAAENLGDGEQFRSQPWGMRLAVADANAWLNIEMPKWVRSGGAGVPKEWLSEVEQIRVDFEGDRIRAGVEVETEEGPRRLWVTLTPRIDNSGSLWMTASTVHLGRLAMPASWVLDRAEADLDGEPGASSILPKAILDLPEARELIRAFRGERPLAVDPVIRLLDGGRQVRLLELAPGDGRLLIVCQTESK